MEVSGRAYTNELPPQLWLMVKGHDHRMLAIDPFGAITMPVYTFDLNAAQEEDLLTMDGLPTNDINIILSHLENNGFFYDLDEIEQLDGISDKASYFLRYHSFDKEYFNTLEEPKLSFSAIIFTPIWKLVYKICAYLIFLILILNVFLLPRKKSTIRSRIWISIRYSLLWIALSILSLGIIVFIPNVLLSMLILLSGLIAFNVIIYFRRKEQLSRLLLMSLLMGLILIASII